MSGEISSDTISDIRRMCNDNDTSLNCDGNYINIAKISKGKCLQSSSSSFSLLTEPCYSQKNNRYTCNMSIFTSVIENLRDLKGLYSNSRGAVEFRLRRKNKTITLQWEPFTGVIDCNGLSYLKVCQSINNIPPYIIKIPIHFDYNGKGRNTFLQLDPWLEHPVILFYLNADGSSDHTCINDYINFPGGSVQWIIE